MKRDVNRESNLDQIVDQPEEHTLKQLFQRTPAAIAILDGPHHVYTFVNPLYQKLFARSEDELIGHSVASVYPEVEGQGIYEIFHQVYSTGEVYIADEFPASFTDRGETRTGYYNFMIQPIRDAGGSITALMVHAYEITQQVYALKKVAESEEKYRSLFESMDQGFCVVEMIFDKLDSPIDYRFLEANPVFSEQTGLENAIGKTAKELLPNLEEHWFRIYGEVAITGNAIRFIEGSEVMGRWFEVHAFRIGDAESKKVAILFTDITRRKKDEQALKESEARFRIMADAAPNIVWVLNPDGSQKYINKFGLDFLGITLEQAITMNWTPHIHPDDLESTSSDLKKAIVNKTLYSKEHRLLGKDGQYRWFLSQGAPTFGSSGNLSGYIGSAFDITERKELEKTIRESESRLRKLTDTVPAIIWITEEDGSCTYLNKHWYEYTGQTREQAEGFGWLEATHPEDKDEAGRLFIEANEKRKPFTAIYRLRNKNGQYRWAIDSGSPKFSEEGIYEGMIGTVVDVHEQQMAREALQISEDRYQNFVRRSSEGIWRFEVEDPIPISLPVEEQMNLFFQHAYLAECNDAMAQMYGYQNSTEMLGMHLADFFPRDAVTETYLRYFIESGYRVHEAESKELSKNGETKFFSNNLIGIVEGDVLFRAWGTQRDITLQKAAEEKIKESEEHFRQLADSMPQIVWTARPDGFLDYYNHRWYEYTGFEENYGDESWLPVLHPDDVKSSVNAWYHSVASGIPFQIEYRFKDRFRGGYRWFLGKAVPIRNKEGEIIKWFGSCTDIDDQKRFSERLEMLVGERTRELKQSNDDLQQFAHVASHDLKEPVRKIKIFNSRLMLETKDRLTLDEKVYIEKISIAADRMSSMIDGVLKYSTLMAFEEKPERVDLSKLMGTIKVDLEITIQQKEARIYWDALPTIEGAPILIYQLFYNLLVNALKFTRAGVTPEITIRSKTSKQDDRDFVQIEIEDNGIGFDQQQAKLIFDTFTRLHSKDHYEGTGLGLALCQKIVERHGGRIQAKGSEGKGATFVIELPLNQQVLI